MTDEPAKLSARQQRIRKEMQQAAAYQSLMLGERTPAMVEEDWARANRCACHFWELWRCHIVQEENARAYTERKEIENAA